MKYVYKIVSALCALAVLPLIVFSPMIYYYLSSLALQGIFTIGSLIGNETITNAMEEFGLETAPTGMADTLSLYDIYDLYSRFSGGDSSRAMEAVESIIPSFFATVAALVLVAVCAIVVAVLAIVCKDNRKVIAASFAGVACSLLFVMLFDNTIAPILAGEIGISDFFDAFWASLIAEVEDISIAPIFYLIPALFGFVALWTILYNATLPDKEKAERMKMIG